MKIPFEKFLVHSLNANEFIVRVGEPLQVKASLENAGEFEKQSEISIGRRMMERYVFIEEAIQEKLERERGEVRHVKCADELEAALAAPPADSQETSAPHTPTLTFDARAWLDKEFPDWREKCVSVFGVKVVQSAYAAGKAAQENKP